MKPAEYQISDLIPQRPPMQMIDQLLHADDRSARGSLYIREFNIFCRNNQLREAAIIEFIAQTAAAFTGYRNLSNHGQVNEGYIGAVKNLVIHKLPPVNAEIQSEITVENEIVGFTIIVGKVFLNQEVIAECEMRILGQPQVQQA